jgi:enoyl-CoA hydratase
MASTVDYEQHDAIAVITLNRPDARNAQDRRLTYELDAAFSRFAADDDARVAILRGAGKHFSSGHDISGNGDFSTPYPATATMWHEHGNAEGAEWLFAYEAEAWVGMCKRWREIPKPTIASVHGACIAGGLALAWACDLIVASDDAFFADPTVTMGAPGIEFFCHPWEMGPRQAKEFLFAGERMPADRAYDVGMVNRVVRREQLDDEVMALAQRIAERPRFALALAKKAVNVSVDLMGMREAIEHAFALHELSHLHNEQVMSTSVVTTDPRELKRSMG